MNGLAVKAKVILKVLALLGIEIGVQLSLTVTVLRKNVFKLTSPQKNAGTTFPAILLEVLFAVNPSAREN
jgi:hypothetical protein